MQKIGERILKHLGSLISIRPSFGKHGKIDHLSVSPKEHFPPFSTLAAWRKIKKEEECFIEIKNCKKMLIENERPSVCTRTLVEIKIIKYINILILDIFKRSLSKFHLLVTYYHSFTLLYFTLFYYLLFFPDYYAILNIFFEWLFIVLW